MTPTQEQPHALVPARSGKPPAKAGDRSLSGLTKAAILMVSLGNETSSQILRQLSEEEVETLGREVARLPVISSSQATSVLEEFEQTSMARAYVLEGGVEYAKKMLTEAFGSDAGLSIVERLLKSLGADAADLVSLQKSDPKQLAKLIYNEHPQVIALVLSHLVPAQAAALLIALPAEIRADVAKRMAQLDQFSPEIVEKIASFIARRLKALGEFSRESYGGVRAVAEMLNRLDSTACDEILADIEKDDAALAETIRQLRFVFEDFLMVDANSMKALLAQTDRKALTVALKGVSPELKRQFMQAMSQRGAEMLNEDIEALGPVRIKEVEAAQQQIIAIARRLQAEGQFSLRGSGGDQYVV